MSVTARKVVAELPDPHKLFPALDNPYSQYCNTNYAAWADDIISIQGILSRNQQQIDDVDTIVSGVEDLLIQLRKKRDHMLSSKTVYEGFISPVRRLPAEILCEIFLLCLPTSTYIRPQPNAAPMVMTRVCERWREIALDTPGLWCSLSLSPFRLWKPQRELPFYAHWLSNTKGRPLSLEVDLRQLDRMEAAIKLAQLYTTQCRELSIKSAHLNDLHLLLKEIPILERLTLYGNLGSVLREISISQPQPRLHTLVISSPVFWVRDMSFFDFGWTNLTHLAVELGTNGNPHISDDRVFFILLEKCKNLEHFIFSPFWSGRNTTTTVTHRILRSLTIANVYTEGALLDKLTLPNLCQLRASENAWADIETVGWGPTIEMPSGQFPSHCNISIGRGIVPRVLLLSIFNLGWPRLTHLVVEVEDTGSIIPMLLRFCRNLESLVIQLRVRHWKITPSSSPSPLTHVKLQSLVLNMDVSPIWGILDMVTLPNLRCLSVGFDGTYDRSGINVWPHAEFKKFLSRSQCSLSTLKIHGVLPLKEEDRAELVALVPNLEGFEMDM